MLFVEGEKGKILLCLSYPLDFLIITLLSRIFLTFGHIRENFLLFLVSSAATDVMGKHDSGLCNQTHKPLLLC